MKRRAGESNLPDRNERPEGFRPDIFDSLEKKDLRPRTQAYPPLPARVEGLRPRRRVGARPARRSRSPPNLAALPLRLRAGSARRPPAPCGARLRLPCPRRCARRASGAADVPSSLRPPPPPGRPCRRKEPPRRRRCRARRWRRATHATSSSAAYYPSSPLPARRPSPVDLYGVRRGLGRRSADAPLFACSVPPPAPQLRCRGTSARAAPGPNQKITIRSRTGLGVVYASPPRSRWPRSSHSAHGRTLDHRHRDWTRRPSARWREGTVDGWIAATARLVGSRT